MRCPSRWQRRNRPSMMSRRRQRFWSMTMYGNCGRYGDTRRILLEGDDPRAIPAGTQIRTHESVGWFVVRSSIEEGHVAHRLRFTLRVHQDLMPAVQGDGCVVGVPDAALDVDAGVPPHGAPTPPLGL